MGSDKEKNYISVFEVISNILVPLVASGNHAVVPLFDKPVPLKSDQPCHQHFKVMFVAVRVAAEYF